MKKEKALAIGIYTLLTLAITNCEEENLPPSAELSVDKVSGTDPLEIRFDFSGTDPDGQVKSYQLDFEGDGVSDFESATAGFQMYEYTKPGSYNAKLTVTDNQGASSSKQVVISVIENKPPTVTTTASVVEGYAPLRVNFSANSSDVDGVVVKYEWDFEGDGIYDYNSASSPETSFTYLTSGIYNATLNVTDDKGKSTKATVSITVKENKYPGFDNLSLFIGAFWKYKWVYDSKTNGSTNPQKTGFTTIEIVDTVSVTFVGLGKLRLYETKYFGTGATYPLIWYGRPYLAFKDGVIYIAQIQNGNWGAAVLFDSRNGEFFGDQGFVGYFSEGAPEVLSTGIVTNTFNPNYSINAVIVSEPFYQPACETISGVQICGTVSHDYQVKEYYFPGIGFGGFYRSGTSVFTGGGFVDIFQTTMTVWLVDTNVN